MSKEALESLTCRGLRRWSIDSSSPKDVCHASKVKCVDKANPPCKRCTSLGTECTFDRRIPAAALRTDKE